MRRNVIRKDDLFMADVRSGLSRPGQKELPPKYFYDDLGSALFDAITLLPEYGLTRADIRLLKGHAAELVKLAGHPSVIAELGSGSATKTRWILNEVGETSGCRYCPIDISPAALRRCELELSDIPGVEVVAFEDSYMDGLRQSARLRTAQSPLMVLFLGSSIGNCSPPQAEELCRNVRNELKPGDVFLVSADLQKDVDRVILAYDDPVGVTAAFNKNMLAHMNRELGADFDLTRFVHEVRYDATAHRIEMHLRSIIDQIVHVGPSFPIPFRRDETIWTESSYKYQPEDLKRLAERSGFECEAQWIDTEWPFAQSVFRAR